MNNKQGKTLGKKILGVCEVTPTPPPEHHYGENKEWVLAMRPC
jgi:hypothetical protein